MGVLKTVLRVVRSFYFITAALALLAAAGIHAALRQYESYLADYEATQPVHLVDAVMEEHFTAPDYREWAAKKPGVALTEFEPLQDYLNLVERMLADGEIVMRDESPNKTFIGERKTYTILSGDTPFAAFTVAKSDQTSPYGFDVWELAGMEAVSVPVTPENAVSVSLLRGSSFFVNGKPVGEAYFVKEDRATDSLAHLPEGVPGIVFDLYTVGGLLNPPSFHAEDGAGAPVVLVYDPDTDVYRAELVTEEAPGDVVTRCTRALLAYCNYMTKDGSLTEVGRYFSRGTHLWRAIQTSEVYWFTRHSGSDYKDITVSDYYRYSDDVYSVRVQAVQYIYRDARTFTYDIDYTFYFAKQANGTYMIYDMSYKRFVDADE